MLIGKPADYLKLSLPPLNGSAEFISLVYHFTFFLFAKSLRFFNAH